MSHLSFRTSKVASDVMHFHHICRGLRQSHLYIDNEPNEQGGPGLPVKPVIHIDIAHMDERTTVGRMRRARPTAGHQVHSAIRTRFSACQPRETFVSSHCDPVFEYRSHLDCCTSCTHYNGSIRSSILFPVWRLHPGSPGPRFSVSPPPRAASHIRPRPRPLLRWYAMPGPARRPFPNP